MASVTPLAKFKSVFLGDQSVGKTSIITGYMYDKIRHHLPANHWNPLSVENYVSRRSNSSFAAMALFRKIAAALPGMDSYSSVTKSEDLVDVNLETTTSNSQGEQQGGDSGGGGCSC